MAEKLSKLFDFVKEKGGAAAQGRLAFQTGLSAKKAAEEADTPELIAKVSEAARDITGEAPPAV
jgi:hypothetical protein